MLDQLAGSIIEQLQRAIAERGRAGFVVSGGETPRALFSRLSRQVLAWDKVTITLADERWIDTDSAQSNENLVRSALLIDKAASAHFIGLKTAHIKAADAEKDRERAVSELAAPFDIVLLGMGDDGHTASLFPNSKVLPSALNMQSKQKFIAITPDPLPEHAPFERLSMTLPLLLNCRWLVLLIAGNSKLNTYNDALAGDDIKKMPVRGVLKQSFTPVSSYWAP